MVGKGARACPGFKNNTVFVDGVPFPAVLQSAYAHAVLGVRQRSARIEGCKAFVEELTEKGLTNPTTGRASFLRFLEQSDQQQWHPAFLGGF
jgi:hypothetical protein